MKAYGIHNLRTLPQVRRIPANLLRDQEIVVEVAETQT